MPLCQECHCVSVLMKQLQKPHCKGEQGADRLMHLSSFLKNEGTYRAVWVRSICWAQAWWHSHRREAAEPGCAGSGGRQAGISCCCVYWKAGCLQLPAEHCSFEGCVLRRPQGENNCALNEICSSGYSAPHVAVFESANIHWNTISTLI